MKQLFSSLLSITKTQTVKDTAIVTIGMGLSTILSALSVFLLARFLGPADFGLYTVSLVLVVILVDAIDLAISSSIVKFAAQKSSLSQSLIKYGFYLKLVLGLILGLVFAAVSLPLSTLLHPQLKVPLLLSSLFIPTIFLYRFPRSLLQAQKRFTQDTIVEVATSAFRLVFVAGFYFFLSLTVITGLLSYLFGAILALSLGSLMISWNFLTAKVIHQTKLKFFSFQKWLTAGFIVMAIHSRIDAVILLRLTNPTVTGVYQAGFRFFLPVMQLAGVLSLVFAPRFASFTNHQQVRIYLIKAAKLAFVLGSLVLLLIPLADILVKIIFGPDFKAAVLPVQILAFGFFAMIAGSPFGSHLIYSASRTKAFFLINLSQIVLLISLDLALIPLYGAVGAAIAVTTTLIVINLVMAGLAFSYEAKA